MFPYKDLVKTRHFPWMTVLLLIVNIVIFFYELTLPEAELTRFIYRYSVIPLEFKVGHNIPGSIGPPPLLTIFSGMFLHGGFFHLIGNMLYLWIFGDNVEDRLGSFRALLFYLLCGVVAAFSQVYTDFGSDIPALGASGAIAGILAAYLLLFPHARIAVLIPVFYFLRRAILPAWLLIIFWFLLQIVQPYFSPIQPGEGGIAYAAHIGGFVAGLLLLPAFRRREKKR